MKIVELYVEEYGEKGNGTVLFLHGGGVSGWMWKRQIQPLEKSFHCLVPDLPGQGKSKGWGSFSIKESAKLVATLIKAKAQGGKAHLVGHSLGAQILVQMLEDFPDVVQSALIQSALVRPIPGINLFLKPTIKLTFPLTRQKWFAKVQAKSLGIPKEYFPFYFEDSCTINSLIMEDILRENGEFKIPEKIGDCSVPVLVLVGEKERGIMIKSAQDLVAYISQAEGYIVKGEGHGFSFENPELFNEILRSWLAGQMIPRKDLDKIDKGC